MAMTWDGLRKAIMHDITEEDVAWDYVGTSVYLRVTGQTTALIEEYDHWDVQKFRDAIDGDLWYDIPFMKPMCADFCFDSEEVK